MRRVLFILPNGANLRREVRSKQPYTPGAVFKTSQGVMVVLKAGVDPDGTERVELRYHVPNHAPHFPICFAGSDKPTTA